MSRILWPLLRKEFRALVPWWAGIVGVMIICQLLESMDARHFPFTDRLLAVRLFTYAIGALCIGALSIGHEYGSRTLPCLLTQPVTRPMLLAVKGAALSTLLGLLALVGLATMGISHSWPAIPRTAVIFWLPLICALCLAPWMTMVSRGTLPGVVFSITLPVLIAIAGSSVGVPYAAAWPIVGVLAIIAAALTWRTFARLEVMGDRSEDLDFVPWTSARTTHTRIRASRHPYWALLTKELRLQQIAFVLAGLVTAIWVVVSLIERAAPELLPDSIRYAATFILGALISILCGATASAEERRLGTADWQRLLPAGPRVQWAIKMGTALIVAVLLASALPAVLHAIAPEPLMNEGFHPMAAILLCVAALYVSSLSDSGIHATLATVPAMVAAAGIVVLVISPVIALAAPFVQQLAGWVYPWLDITQPDWRWHRYPLSAGWFMCVVVVLSFAGVNHRTADRSIPHVLRQCAWLAAVVMMVLTVSMFIQAVLLEWRRQGMLNS